MSDGTTFYFVIYSSLDRSSIKVIDLAYCVSYERDEWPAMSQENFRSPDEAIVYARALAKKYGLVYEMFESRYNKELNEQLFL